MPKPSNGCTGACCAAFTLSYKPDELHRLRRRLQDGRQVADMVIPLTVEEANERSARFGGTAAFRSEHSGYHYTCRHWDEETRLCTIYETRPRVCRRFPGGEPCKLGEGCTCVGERHPKGPGGGAEHLRGAIATAIEGYTWRGGFR